MKKVLKFVQDLPTKYLFQEFFKMLIEYMHRRSHIEKEEFDTIVEQNLESEMATRKVFKSTYEIVEEIAQAKGEAKGLAVIRKAIAFMARTTSMTDVQIAKELDAEESFVKAIRQELKAASATN
jgi:lysyl-tRNA synthetase class I